MWIQSLGLEDPWSKACYSTPVLLLRECHGQRSLVGYSPWGGKESAGLINTFTLGFPGGSDGKESDCNAGDLGSIPESGRSPGRGNDNPLQHSCLGNSWTEESGRLQSIALQSQTRLSDFLWLFTFMHWRRKWQSTPVFLPGESEGRGSLVGCHPWGHTKSDMTEVT